MINVALLESDEELNGICFSVLSKSHHINITERFYNFYAFQNALSDLQTQIVITDISLPGINILKLINVSKKIRPDINFIVSSAWVQPDLIYKCLRAGASGYVNMFDAEQLLLKKINEIANRQAQMSVPVAQLIRNEHANQSASTITQIQSQIIKLFADGFSHTYVCNAVNKSIAEVQIQIGNIYKAIYQSSVSV